MLNADPGTHAPPRGTRPPNRRQLILAAAADLFARHGYREVSMSAIAEAVAIRPSALYRHFPGKQELLREVVHSSFAAFRAALELATRQAGEDALREFARTVLDHRSLGVLWQREARHLDPEALQELRGELRVITVLLAERVRARRPELEAERAELLARAVLSALVSVSFHRVELPRAHYDQLLIDIMTRIVDAELPAADPHRVATNPLPPRPPPTRRDQLIEQATRLFAGKGYRGVGIEEIGAAAGIAGPSIYHHFASKSELMIAVLQPGADFLHEHLRRTLAATDDPSAALDAVLGTYIDFGLTNRHLLELLVLEIAQAPDEWPTVRRTERDYVARWVGLLRAIHPELTDGAARVQVQAAMNIVNDLARSPRLAAGPGLGRFIHAVDTAVLGLMTDR